MDSNCLNNVVDIETFCEDKEYLNLPGNNLNLFIGQKVILKSFYLGSIGNEKLKLTEEEWQWLYSKQDDLTLDGITYYRNIKDVIKKIHEKENSSDYNPFTELILAFGRRSSKDLISNLITAYEAYKLLVINPHKYYNLPNYEKIVIINVFVTKYQASNSFNTMRNILRSSNFFYGRVARETNCTIDLYTDKDLERSDNNNSISLLYGCNVKFLNGYNAISLIFNEIDFFANDKSFVNRLKPSLLNFHKDGKIIMNSSFSLENSDNGVLYEEFKNSKNSDKEIADSILAYQLPSWDVNENMNYNDPILKRARADNPRIFATEFGSQWHII